MKTDTKIDMMKQTLQLAETMEESLQYIQKQLNNVTLEETMYLFEDMISGFSVIERLLSTTLEEHNTETLQTKSEQLQNGLNVAVTYYEQKNQGKLQEVFQFNVIPNMKRFKQALDEQFGEYVLN